MTTYSVADVTVIYPYKKVGKEKVPVTVEFNKDGSFKGNKAFLSKNLGRPFLYLRNVKRSTVKGDTVTPTTREGSDHLIPLRPRKINKVRHSALLEPIINYINSITT
jgi:hypothetical protein